MLQVKKNKLMQEAEKLGFGILGNNTNFIVLNLIIQSDCNQTGKHDVWITVLILLWSNSMTGVLI